jgi:hypothetical protein
VVAVEVVQEQVVPQDTVVVAVITTRLALLALLVWEVAALRGRRVDH